MKEEAIFFEASQRSGEERNAYLDEACGDDAALRQRLQKMLDAFDRPDDFLKVPLEEATTAYPSPSLEKAGTIIAGRYKLVEEIGEGGMGTVWVAQQTEPVKRIVAVKLIKPGMDSKAMLARFESERQALALMEHPNIARVLDGGATADGRPFFVMELVKGVPITQFCDARKLTPQQRLELFVPVCNAIQHAHQKGVIHRDIKPSNVLIALYDDKPVPKVIDFGVAKAAGQMLTDKSLMTGFGAVIGTPEYMSPEQASLNNLDIDTRSDVYSLGVLLYELLAGSPPFKSDDLKSAGMFEMLRIVCEEEPPRPSIKLSTANKLASISADRGTEPKKLTGLLRNELDWIVMKALEKDRARRYETVNGFAADVQRYLAGEAVQAHPPSTAYRLRKFTRKHRVGLTTATAFAVLLVAAVVVSGWLAVIAQRAEKLADEKRIEAETNAKEAKKNEELFQKEAAANYNGMIEAEISAKKLQVDLDLAELRTDPKVGLLRLARPLKQNLESRGRKMVVVAATDGTDKPAPLELDNDRGDYKSLREFTTMAVLAAGQQYASLLPPITHDGQPVAFAWFSPDYQTLLTLGEDYTARLWETRTFRPIAILRQGNERIINCGFSPDGRTVFTDDQTSVARFWDAPMGRYRTAIQARKNRYEAPQNCPFSHFPRAVSQIGASRLLTRKSVSKESETWTDNSGLHTVSPFLGWEGPVELWDTETGRLVSRLDGLGCNFQRFQFINQGHWITTIDESGSTLLVFSADDGRLLARLNHPTGDAVHLVDVGPNARRVATVSGKKGTEAGNPHLDVNAVGPFSLQVWDTETWRAEPMTTPLGNDQPSTLRCWIDDSSQGLGTVSALEQSFVDGRSFWTVYRYGQNEPVAEFPGNDWSLAHPFGRAGQLAHNGNGQIFDCRTWQRLPTPPGRKFHPDLTRFSSDGRFVGAFVNGEAAVIDTQTDKAFPVVGIWHSLPGLGMASRHSPSGEGSTGQVGNRDVQFLPPADRLNLLPPDRLELPPEPLELWAQVAVRGHLDDQGAFIKWDQETWEKKRQELAAKPAPIPDFPFPGFVATDKLHWLRAEFDDAKSDAERLRLAKELLRKAELFGERAGAVRWKEEVKKLTAPAKP
jgi:serine/threonine protein kinase/WD40 repeat protein